MWNISSLLPSSWRQPDLWAVSLILIVVLALDFLTPMEYVIGYLYLCPLLLATGRLPRRFTIALTGLVVLLMLLNLWLPDHTVVNLSAFVNRLIAATALVVTAVLGDRNATYARAVANQQAQLQTKTQMEAMREDFAAPSLTI